MTADLSSATQAVWEYLLSDAHGKCADCGKPLSPYHFRSKTSPGEKICTLCRMARATKKGGRG